MNFLKNLGSHDKGVSDNWFITIERAEGVDDKDRWSKADTYVVVEFGGQHVRTHTINNNRTPFWNETFNLKVQSDHVKDLHVKLMDDDFGVDDPIGDAVISREDLPFNLGDERYLRVPVFRKEKTTGIIVLRVKKFNELIHQQQQQQHLVQSSQPHTTSSSQSSNINTQPQDVSSVTQQQYPSNNNSQQMQQQPIYSEKQPTTYSSQHLHHQQQQPFTQPASSSLSQQPNMGGGSVHTNYQEFQQKRY